jgi:hypothetical protein
MYAATSLKKVFELVPKAEVLEQPHLCAGLVQNENKYKFCPQSKGLVDRHQIIHGSATFSDTARRLRNYRVGGHPLFEWPSSHTTVRTVPYTAVQ